MDFVYEFVYIYCVKSFTHVKSNYYCSVWGLFLVETSCDCVGYFVQRSCGGMIGFEAVLVFKVGYVLCDFWKDDFFQSFDYG